MIILEAIRLMWAASVGTIFIVSGIAAGMGAIDKSTWALILFNILIVSVILFVAPALIKLMLK